MRGKLLLSFVLFVGLMVLVLHTSSTVTRQRGISRIVKQGHSRLTLYINHLQGMLGKYESLPELLAIDDSLVRTLLNPHEEQRIEKLNKYLETINLVSDALDTYLLNKDGLTIAASNWNTEKPFVGRNFSYRPYFKEAMNGKLGRYFALGTTSAKRGYYFAYPVIKGEEILGAVVMKLSIDTAEEQWAQGGEHFLVSDPDGVIFITTNPQWRYRTIYSLNEDVLSRIEESRRYPGSNFISLGTKVGELDGDAELFRLDSPQSKSSSSVVKQSQYMPQAGWNVHIFTDIKVLDKEVFLVNLIVGVALSVCYILILLLSQRHHRMAEVKSIEERAKRALEYANEQLESRVLERTKQLTEANIHLKSEILERKETEKKLKKTRKELVHAGKLAVLGQMAAGINHELNQPLAAIRTYADNGRNLLMNGRCDDALGNLEQIAKLTDRMAQIGIQLKLFSRKSSGKIGTVSLHGVISGAMEIVNPSLKKANIDIQLEVEQVELMVRANYVLLQQVFVNLINNAIHAQEDQDEKIVLLQCVSMPNRVRVSVTDNGPGVPAEMADEIFEPFYTTKKSGQGLGLGLTISNRIVNDFGGFITVRNTDRFENGAVFEFELEKDS